MIELSDFTAIMSAAARGRAEAVSVGIAANAQAATPINNNRFMFGILLGPRDAAMGLNVVAAPKFRLHVTSAS